MVGVFVVVATGLWPPLPELVTQGSAAVDGPLDTVDIDLDDGTLVVVETNGGAVELDHTSTWRGWRPTVTVDVDEGIATVVADCPWRPVVGSCSTDLYLVVPEGVQLRVRSGHGAVDLRELSGWVEVSMNGDLMATDIASPELLVSSGGGDVDVAFIEAPSRVDVDSGGGDVLIGLPGGPYEADLAGDPVINEVPTEELAERVLNVDGGSGAVTIRASDG